MASPYKLITEIDKAIDDAVEAINSTIPAHQSAMLDEIALLLKELETGSGGTIKQSVANLKLIGKIKSKLEEVVSSDAWNKDVGKFVQQFDKITALQNKYFQSIENKFTPPTILKEIRSQALDSTIESLTANGINSAITDKVQNILRTNITGGNTYGNIVKQVRDYIVTNTKGAGALEKYAKQITTDSLNQYAAQYTDAVTNDLGLDWFMYVGTIIETSRPFCKACIEKRYIHRSELPKVVAGDFPEFEKQDGVINSKTGLPAGMIDGTTAQNFIVYRGGYNCGHKLVPVVESAVPKSVRDALGKPAFKAASA